MTVILQGVSVCSGCALAPSFLLAQLPDFDLAERAAESVDFGGGIDAGIFRLSGGNAGGEAKKQRQGENQGDHFGKLFH